ncbi:hypothetical protein B0T20DRAFT_479536 [Sordaria brevicollis]|uniref:Uncharacterized protein n=1 Tax=Sordaria brevicollis TaxID=83679 RepID=A0AAE0PF29_SORBR|nr:hypothetical protein B0T20DRAFT_479536 [Sordaria brevicollis]
MDRTIDSPLSSYIADDAPWGAYPLEVLQEQCLKRTLSSKGDATELRLRLEDYHLQHKREERDHFPWRAAKDMIYVQYEMAGQGYNPLLLKVRDRSDFLRGRIEKDFTLVVKSLDPGMYSWCNVTIGRNPTCDCTLKNAESEDGYADYTCPHIIYVLKYILGCPEPLRLQGAFLTDELVKIFQHSTVFDLMERYVVPQLNPNTATQRPRLKFEPRHIDRPAQTCTLCFRFIYLGDKVKFCHRCGLPVHLECRQHLQDHRKGTGRKSCSLHHDFNEWTYELLVARKKQGSSLYHFRGQGAEALEGGFKQESDDVDMEDAFGDDFWLEGNELDVDDGSDLEIDDDDSEHQVVNDYAVAGNDQLEMTLAIRPRRSVEDHE